MPNNKLDFESIDQVEVFKENGDVIGTVKVSGVRSIEAAMKKPFSSCLKRPILRPMFSRFPTCRTEPNAVTA